MEFMYKDQLIIIMSRNLISSLIGNAKISGRHHSSKPTYAIDDKAIQTAIMSSVMNQGSLCPICLKVIQFSRGVLKSGDAAYVFQDAFAPSCDRIVNGGVGYIFRGDGQNNVRMTHRASVIV